MRATALGRPLLAAGLLLAPVAGARELTPEELRRMPRPDPLPVDAAPSSAGPVASATGARAPTPAEDKAAAAGPPLAAREPEAEPLPFTQRRWPATGGLRGTLGVGGLGQQPRWRMGLSGRPLAHVGWSVGAYHHLESPDVYGLRVSGAWRSVPWLLLEGHLGREVLGRDGSEAELAALRAWRLGALTLFAGPAAGVRLSSASHGVAGAAGLLQHGALTLRYDYRLRWSPVRLEGASHVLQAGWLSPQGLLVAGRALRAEEPPDARGGPRWRQEEVAALLDVPVGAVLALQLEALLGRRFESSQPPPAFSFGGELGLAVSF